MHWRYEAVEMPKVTVLSRLKVQDFQRKKPLLKQSTTCSIIQSWTTSQGDSSIHKYTTTVVRKLLIMVDWCDSKTRMTGIHSLFFPLMCGISFQMDL